MLQDDGVHLDFDLTPEDFKILDEQESLFLTQHVSRQPESTADVNVISLQSQLAKLQIDFESMKKEKTTKDGEVALLRQKLNTMESERLDALSRHAKKVSSLEQERATLQAHWQRELDKLQTEIKFKDAECNIHYDKSLTTHHRPAAPFASTFGDLIKGKKPRTGLAMRDTSCEVTGMLGSPSRMTLVESGTLSKDINIEDLFSALGFADDSMVYYVALILDYMVNYNQAVGSLIRTGIPPYNISDDIQKTLKKDDLPTSSSLLNELCQYISGIPDSKCLSTVHLHFRILKQILLGNDGTIPDPVHDLFSNDTIMRKLYAFQPFRLDIIVDVWDLVYLCLGDKRIGDLIMKQNSGLGCSILNLFNEILVKRLFKTPFHSPLGEIEKFLVIMHHSLVVKRILPASVAFEPLTLRLLCRRLASAALNDDKHDLTQCYSDHLVFVQILYQVLVVEHAPSVPILIREFIVLLYAMRIFNATSPYKDFLKVYTTDILLILERDLGKVIAGEYLPVPSPEVKRRDIPLTEGQERALYKSWEDQVPSG